MGSSPYGRYVRARRIDAGLSLRTVAEALGVSHVYLGEVERGVRPPLKRDRWPALVKAIPGVTIEGQEQSAATSRPLQIALENRPAEYQNLALALARRIEKQDLNKGEMISLLEVLRGSAKED